MDASSKPSSPQVRHWLPPRVSAGFAVAIAVVIFVAGLSYLSLRYRSETRDRVTHTLEVLQALEAVLSKLKDAETGQRGLLLTGEDRYLEPYTRAKLELPESIRSLSALLTKGSGQQRQLSELQQLMTQKMGELALTIDLHRQKDDASALKIVLSDEGRIAMDAIRTLIDGMKQGEQRLLAERQEELQRATEISTGVTWAGSAVLLLLIGIAAVMTSRGYRASERERWIRSAQVGIGAEIIGEQRLDQLGSAALGFLARYLDAEVGALFVHENGRFRQVAGHALEGVSNGADREAAGLLAQAAKEARALHIKAVPPDYLTIRSSLGRAAPRELLIAPASADGEVHAVVELGFFRPLGSAELELMDRVSTALGIAVRTSKDRTRQALLLEETQRQGEELQQQQEELRVSNEELEEQGRALKESQARLESQHAELEQINTMLEEQAQQLEGQRDDLVKAQQVTAEKAAELERSNQYKSEFLANMSHELRTPLNSSLIFAKLLADNKQGNLTEEQVRFAQAISSGGEELLALINDILDLSAIEARKVELDPQALVIAPTLETMLKSFQPIAQQKGLLLTLVVDPNVPARIETDGRRFGQILKNLLSNALKFTQKGEVSLRVSKADGGALSFNVRDTGIGIAPENHQVIFEAFRQGDGSTNRKYGGTGLGLSIARDLAQLLGGDLGLQSTLGEGSMFTLTLPLAFTPGAVEAKVLQPPAAVAAQRPPAKMPVQNAAIPSATTLEAIRIKDDRHALVADQRRILVIEDDERFASILLDLARERGFQGVVTHSASQGLLAAVMHRPNAIVLDLQLPDHFGLAVLDQLKHNPVTRHIPVHIVSVADYTQEALELGAVGYGLKPVKREELIDAFQKLEAKFSQGLKRLLIVEDDPRQRDSLLHLLGGGDTEIVTAASAAEALAHLAGNTFDCMVIDLNLPDLSGYELLEKMAQQEDLPFPPVIVHTGRVLSREEEQNLRRYSKTIIIKDARSPERLLDEVTLFLHQVEAKLPAESQRLLKVARNRDAALDGRRILIVEDDVRNVFALSSLLEPKGAKILIARNGREAIEALVKNIETAAAPIDLVLMDIMMPEMDGFTAMREIRKRGQWKKLPIIALTAKAMPDDQDKCLAAGANDYIAKPLDPDKLISLVRVWMPK